MNETILQFGAGNFLRAFADLIVDQANRAPDTAVGRIVVVQTTGKERAELLNRAAGRYHVAIRGLCDGVGVDRVETVASISRALHAGTGWPEVLAFARGPNLRWIFSNSTEAGFALDPRDSARPSGSAPCSFPAKLLDVLLARFEAGAPAPAVFPCELIPSNGAALRALVLRQADLWSVPADARAWIADACAWVDTLVDCIVPGPPADHPLAGVDPLLLGAEPYAFWGVQGRIPFIRHSVIHPTDDLAPYHLRKVRILNGAHSALVAHAMPRGLRTVRDCVEDPEVGPWLERLLFEEIVPAIEDRAPSAADFARVTLERFQNPFLDHRLASIALNHEAKVKTRLLPTIADYESRFGRTPPLLSSALGLRSAPPRPILVS